MDPLDVTEVVDPLLLSRGAATALVLVVTLAVLLGVREGLRQYAQVRGIRSLRGRFVYRVVRVLVLLFTTILLVSIWGLEVENLWVYVTGLLGLIAIGFFAVWSLLSNVVAGVFLFLSDPFKADDEVEVIGEEIRGRVLEIRPLFVVLREDDGHTVYLPNNLLFQKAFRRLADSAKAPPEEPSAQVTPEGAD